jgi:hypothetical protein
VSLFQAQCRHKRINLMSHPDCSVRHELWDCANRRCGWTNCPQKGPAIPVMMAYSFSVGLAFFARGDLVFAQGGAGCPIRPVIQRGRSTHVFLAWKCSQTNS